MIRSTERPSRRKSGRSPRKASAHKQVKVTVSIGLASPDREITDPEKVIKAAEKNFIRPKRAGEIEPSTNLTLLLGKLQSIHPPQHFIDISSYGQIVDDLVLYHTVFLDRKFRSHLNTVGMLNALVLGDLVLNVGNYRKINRFDAPIFDRRAAPGKVRKLRANGNPHDFNVSCLI